MKFEGLPLADALGRILGHNVTGENGRRLLRKGRALSAEDLQVLRSLGRDSVFVACLDAGDVSENEAARRIAEGLAEAEIRSSRPATGRVNFFARELGLLRLDLPRLERLNQLSGLTLATLARESVVAPGKMLATLKIIPYALPGVTVEAAEAVGGGRPLLWLSVLPPTRTGLILSGAPGARERVLAGFRDALKPRLAALRSELAWIDYVPLEDEAGVAELTETLKNRGTEDIDLLILAGETAIMDRYDLAPRAVEAAGGRVEVFGAPVDPGNLLLLGSLGKVPILGAPGCARSPRKNVVDLVLPRLLVGDVLNAQLVASWGHGGLLDDVPERPLPRSFLQ